MGPLQATTTTRSVSGKGHGRLRRLPSPTRSCTTFNER